MKIRSQWPLACQDCGFESRLGMDVSFECCSSLLWADHSSRGVLPSVVCLSVIEEPQRGEGLGLQGLSSHEKRNRN